MTKKKYLTSIDCHVHALPSKHFQFDFKMLEEYASEANDKGIDAIVLSEHLHSTDFVDILRYLDGHTIKVTEYLYLFQSGNNGPSLYIIPGAEVPIILDERGSRFYGDSLVIDKISNLINLRERQDQKIKEFAWMMKGKGQIDYNDGKEQGKFMSPFQVRSVCEEGLFGPCHITRTKGAPYFQQSKPLYDRPATLVTLFKKGIFNMAEINGKDHSEAGKVRRFYEGNGICPVIVGSDCHVPRDTGRKISPRFRGQLGIGKIIIPDNLLTPNDFTLDIISEILCREDIDMPITAEPDTLKHANDVKRMLKERPGDYGFSVY